MADEDDLQQLGGGCFEVGEQAHLLQHFRGQLLCLVDDDHDPPAKRMAREQVLVQSIDQLLDAAAGRFRYRHAQFVADALHQFQRRHPRVQDERHVGVVRHLRQQATHHRGLAGAHFARQLHEATRMGDAIQQMRQGLRVAVTQEEVPRVWRDGERWLGQPEKRGVHGGMIARAGADCPDVAASGRYGAVLSCTAAGR